MIQHLECPHVDHQGQRITAVCMNSQCSLKSHCCHKCENEFHKNCKNHIVFIDKIPQMISKIEKQVKNVYERLEAKGTTLYQIMAVLDIIHQPIKDYNDPESQISLGKLDSLGRLLKSNPDLIIQFIGEAEQEIQYSLTKLFLNLKLIVPNLQENKLQNFLRYQREQMQIESQKITQWNASEAQNLFKKSMELQKTDAKSALNCIVNATYLVPNNQEYLNQQGRCLQRFCLYKEAIECFKKSILIKLSKEAYQQLAFSLQQQDILNNNYLNIAINCIQFGLVELPNDRDLISDLALYKKAQSK